MHARAAAGGRRAGNLCSFGGDEIRMASVSLMMDGRVLNCVHDDHLFIMLGSN